MTDLTWRDALGLALAGTALASPTSAATARASPAIAGQDGLTFAAGDAVLTRGAWPALVRRYAGESAWRVTVAGGLSQLATAPRWTGFRVAFGPITAAIEIVGDAPAWTFSGSLAHDGYGDGYRSWRAYGGRAAAALDSHRRSGARLIGAAA